MPIPSPATSGLDFGSASYKEISGSLLSYRPQKSRRTFRGRASTRRSANVCHGSFPLAFFNYSYAFMSRPSRGIIQSRTISGRQGSVTTLAKPLSTSQETLCLSNQDVAQRVHQQHLGCVRVSGIRLIVLFVASLCGSNTPEKWKKLSGFDVLVGLAPDLAAGAGLNRRLSIQMALSRLEKKSGRVDNTWSRPQSMYRRRDNMLQYDVWSDHFLTSGGFQGTFSVSTTAQSDSHLGSSNLFPYKNSQSPVVIYIYRCTNKSKSTSSDSRSSEYPLPAYQRNLGDFRRGRRCPKVVRDATRHADPESLGPL